MVGSMLKNIVSISCSCYLPKKEKAKHWKLLKSLVMKNYNEEIKNYFMQFLCTMDEKLFMTTIN